MFGPIRAKSTVKTTPKKLPSNSRFAFIRIFVDKCYRDPYKWTLIKSIAFFATSIVVIRAVSDADILPSSTPSSSQPAAY